MKLGKRGEDEACRFLENAGHRILDRNWRSGHLEIDIVTLDREGIHFVEVKTRMAPLSADPLESVGREKQRKIEEAARRWLRSDKDVIYSDEEVFFDVVGIVFEKEDIRVDYYPQAYMPIMI